MGGADKPEDESEVPRWREEIGALEAAEAALSSLLTEGACGPLVKAVITKYLALSLDELQEWQVIPHQSSTHPFFFFLILQM